MEVSKIQKIISFCLIFFLLFGFALRVPVVQFFSTQTFAQQKDYYDLISILVTQDAYDRHKSKIVQYSRDIQKHLANTRVVILPVPENAQVIDIASLNEKLFFEGYA